MNGFIVYDNLNTGKENAISANDLTDKLNLKSTRELRHEVSAERAQGIPIASLPAGYFRCKNKTEILECYRFHRSRAVSEAATANMFKKMLEPYEGQLSMFDMQEDEDINRWLMNEGADV